MSSEQRTARETLTTAELIKLAPEHLGHAEMNGWCLGYRAALAFLRAAPAPTDVAATLIRYLDEQFGLALRPEHAREIRRILAADRTQPIETPPENRPQPMAAPAPVDVQAIAEIAWRCIRECKGYYGPPVMCPGHQQEAQALVGAVAEPIDPHVTGRAKCRMCNHVCQSVAPVGTDLDNLECPNCHRMTLEVAP
jgi:hypothetical protein